MASQTLTLLLLFVEKREQLGAGACAEPDILGLVRLGVEIRGLGTGGSDLGIREFIRIGL